MDTKTKELLAALLPLLLAQLTTPAEAVVPAAPAAPDPTVGNTPGGLPMTTFSGPMVEVRPTGVRAGGVVRWWPVPLAGQRWFDYLMWCTSIKRPDGLPFIAPQYRATIAVEAMGSAGYRPAFTAEEFPWRADCFAHPEEWRTQAQIDQTARDEAGWVETHRKMQQGGDDAAVGGSV